MTYTVLVKVEKVTEENHASGAVWREMYFFMPVRGANGNESPLDGLAQFVELELDVQPKILANLEKAGLKISPGGDVDISISSISKLGITLHVACDKLNDYEIGLRHWGQMFIPMNRIVSINELFELAELAKRHKAIAPIKAIKQ